MNTLPTQLLTLLTKKTRSTWGSLSSEAASIRWDGQRIDLNLPTLNASGQAHLHGVVSRAEDKDGRRWLQLALHWAEGHMFCLRAIASDSALIDMLGEVSEEALRGAETPEEDLLRLIGGLIEGGVPLRQLSAPPPIPPRSTPKAPSPQQTPSQTQSIEGLSLEELEEKIPYVEDAAEQSSMLIRCAQIAEEEREDIYSAIVFLQQAMELDPAQPTTMEALTRLYTITDDYYSLINILEQRAELTTSDEERQGLLTQLALISEELLADGGQAIDYHQRILAFNPSASQSLTALNRLYTAHAEWCELTEILMKQAEQAEEASQTISFLFQLAHIHLDMLDNASLAQELFKKILALDPTHADARGALAACSEH